jgi:hypothetical protein
MEKQPLYIPISIFKETRLTPFELIVKYLKETKNLTYAEIGRQLNRNVCGQGNNRELLYYT